MAKRWTPSEKTAVVSLVLGIVVAGLLMIKAHQSFVTAAVAGLIVMGAAFGVFVQIGGNARNMDR